MLKDWNACAREVGRALSRYDGHTTNVKGGLETILSVPASPLFSESPSHLALVLSSETEATRGVGKRAAEANLSHGISLGFLTRIIPGGPKTAKISLSPLGRAYRAALRLRDSAFRDFLVTGAILDRDFDMYGLLLKCALESERHTADKTDFQERVKSLLQQRRDWFLGHVPSPIVREEISAHIQWMGQSRKSAHIQRVGQSRELADTSINYHFNMRCEWARHLKHMDKNRELTRLGREIAARVQSVSSSNSMFWLAPTPECARKIGIVADASESVFSGWELLRPKGPECAPDQEMIRQLADFMVAAFDAIRLHSFAQAPLSAVLPYVLYQEEFLGHKVDARNLFQKVLKEHRETLHCMLLGVLEDSQYRLREVSLSAPART